MKNLSAFLAPAEASNLFEVVSDRFRDEAGKPIAWEFRAITHEENKEINKLCTKRDRKGNETFDFQQYKELLVTKSVAYPDLQDAQLQQGLGVYDAVAVMKLLCGKLGEFAIAYKVACDVNGLNNNFAEDLDEAKNESGGV